MTVIPFPDRCGAVHPRPSALAPTCLVDLLPRYEAALNAAKRRPRGVKLYLWLVRRFMRSLPAGATMADITAASIRRYQEQLGARCAASTVENALFGIRRFCVWAMRAGLRDDDPTEALEWPRVTVRVPDGAGGCDRDGALALEAERPGGLSDALCRAALEALFLEPNALAHLRSAEGITRPFDTVGDALDFIAKVKQAIGATPAYWQRADAFPGREE